MQFERGTIETPVFMPVGTAGTVKAMTTAEVESLRRRDNSRQYFSFDAAPGNRGHSLSMGICTTL